MTEPGPELSLEELILKHSRRKECFQAPFEQLNFYCNFEANVRKPVIYQPGLIIVAQGEKRAHSGTQTLAYNAEELLVLTAPMPIECQVVEASRERPYLAVIVPLLPEQFLALSVDLELTPSSSAVERGLAVTPLSPELRAATQRFLQTLLCSEKTRALGESHLREVYYYALKSASGERLKSFLRRDSQTQSLIQVLLHIHSHLEESFSVKQLAESANLSESAFHRAFKNFTSESPVRYIKKMKLNRAYSLMHYDGHSVKEAAYSVGYHSASQFSREFKRMYGNSPTGLLKETKQL